MTPYRVDEIADERGLHSTGVFILRVWELSEHGVSRVLIIRDSLCSSTPITRGADA